MTTEILGLREITVNQGKKFLTHNDALRQLEGRMVRVIDRDVGTTPATPAEGDTYIVDQLGGLWSPATINDIAHFFGGIWVFYTPVEGVRLWVNDEDAEVVYDGAAWVVLSILASLLDDNVIINGNFDIWQRGTSFTAVSGVYTADRFRWDQVGTGVVDILRSTSVPNNLSDFSLQIDITTADASIAAADEYIAATNIEGYDSMRFGFGTSDATQLTLSFSCLSSKTGIHCVSFVNSAANRSYVIEFTIAVADTWENFTMTLTADTAGTWLTDSNIGLRVRWTLAAGSDFQGTPNTWNAANNIATSNQVNVMDNVANNFHISRVELKVGNQPAIFKRRLFGAELALARRYYQTFDGSLHGEWNDSAVVELAARCDPTMRAIPTLVLEDTTPTIGEFGVANRTGTASTIVASSIQPDGFMVSIDGFAGATAENRAVGFNASAIISADSEL